MTEEESKTYPNPTYSWFVVVLMMLFYVLSFMDRQIIAVLIDPIKADLSLSDVQISLIGGISFTLFYSTTGIVIGRLADSMNRPWLIAMGVFVWSLTTALCGLASKFWHLFILRMGVGLGESALLPSTLSLLADYFPPKRRATPTSVFLFGAPIGIGLSFVIGGYLLSVAQNIAAAPGWKDVLFIGGTAAWQIVLLFLGVLGMVMTFALVAVREPRNDVSSATTEERKSATKAAEPASLDEVKRYGRKHWFAIFALYVGMSLISLAAYAQGFWDVTFLARTFDVEASSITFRYGLVQMFGGLAGMLFAGVMADKLSKRGIETASVRIVIVGCAIATPFSFWYPLTESMSTSLWLMIIAIFGSNMGFACAASAIQRMFPGSMLGLAAGVYFFVSNAVGIGIGPTAVAAITDYVFEDPEMIRYSIAAVGGISRALAFVLIFAGLRAYSNLLRELEHR